MIGGPVGARLPQIDRPPAGMVILSACLLHSRVFAAPAGGERGSVGAARSSPGRGRRPATRTPVLGASADPRRERHPPTGTPTRGASADPRRGHQSSVRAPTGDAGAAGWGEIPRRAGRTRTSVIRVHEAIPPVRVEPVRELPDPAEHPLGKSALGVCRGAATRCGGSDTACGGFAQSRRTPRRTAAGAARPSFARAPRVPWRGSVSCIVSVGSNGWDWLAARQPVVSVRPTEPRFARKLKAVFVDGRRFLSIADRGQFSLPAPANDATGEKRCDLSAAFGWIEWRFRARRHGQTPGAARASRITRGSRPSARYVRRPARP